jgi:predicted GNAT family N-acyltransferase
LITAYAIRLLRWSEAPPGLAEVRNAVFVREQGVAEALEWDGLDDDAMHALAVSKDGRAIGTVRLLENGQIGRMAVLPAWRGLGVGRALLERMVCAAQARGLRTVWLHAQTHAVGFYRRQGFMVTSAEFLDAGIPHVAMLRHLDEPHGAFAATGDGSIS